MANRFRTRADQADGAEPTARGLRSLGVVQQLWLLALVSLTAVAVLAGVTLSRVSGLRADQERVLTRLVPAADSLSRAQTTFAAASASFAGIVTDRTDLVNRLSVYSSDTTQATSAWNDYTRLPVRFKGEAKLRKQYETLFAARTRLLTQILLVAPGESIAEVKLAAGDTAVEARDLATLRDKYESSIHRAMGSAATLADRVVTDEWIAGAASLAVLIGLFGAALQIGRVRQRDARVVGIQRAARAYRDELEARFQRALELVRSEEDAYPRVEQALREAVPDTAIELLVADSSRAHFHQVVSTESNVAEPGCSVSAPAECSAASRGQTQVFASSSALDACSYLLERTGGECTAVCVPVSIAGKSVGVVHATRPLRKRFDHEVIATVELIARKAGERIGMLRAFARSETQARTDQLSGLLNRRSLETQIIELTNDNRAYVVAFGDLDHFKQLNDVHGHDAGDRALRLFARVLRDNVRPSDIPARYGGEEFVTVLPDCNIADAVSVLERVRDRLAIALQAGNVPHYTVSFGVAATEGDMTFSQTLELADQALLEAKRSGRDRIAIRNSDPSHLDDVPSAPSAGPDGGDGVDDQVGGRVDGQVAGRR